MKKLLFVALLFIPFFGNAQTTLEEWNYVTKGYKIQIESGLDMKKGYNIKHVGSYTYDNYDAVRTINFKKLIKTSNNTVCAIMLEYIRKDKRSTNVVYYCIPHKLSSPEIWICQMPK